MNFTAKIPLEMNFQCANEACKKSFLIDAKEVSRESKCPYCGTPVQLTEQELLVIQSTADMSDRMQ